MHARSLVLVTGMLLSIAGAAKAAPLPLTDAQLDNVTAGASGSQIPLVSSVIANGDAGVNQFSPSIATLLQTVTDISICVFCINSPR